MSQTADQRAERRRAEAEADKRQDYRRAGLTYDSRTAAGRRDLVIHDLGHSRRARAASYGTLIRNKAERTAPRVQAMRYFDQLCHEAWRQPPEPFDPKIHRVVVYRDADGRWTEDASQPPNPIVA